MRGHFKKYEGKRGTTWMVKYYLGYDGNGRKKYVTKRGFPTKKAAEAYLAEVSNSLNKGTYVDPSKLTMAEYLDQWIDHKRERVRPKTADIYTRTVRLHVVPRLGRVSLTDLKPIHLRDLYVYLQRHSKLSARYVAQIHSMMHDALDRAVKWEMVNRNVADAVDPPRAQRVKFDVWGLNDVRRFLHADLVIQHRFYVAFLLALTTGMRQGEILGLRWSDVDIETAEIHVRYSLGWLDGEYRFGPTKSESGERDIKIPPQVVDSLRAHKARQNEDRLAYGEGYLNHDLVVRRINGNFVSQSFLRKRFTDLIKTVEMPYIRFHDLRHTHASILLELGEEMKVIQGQLGHAKLAITADTYTHLSRSLQERPAQLIEGAFFDPDH